MNTIIEKIWGGRLYDTFPIALNEIKRELKEMGIEVITQSVQNIREPIEAKELQNYTYTVLQPDFNQIEVKNLEWCQEEFAERICGQPLNPGHAWKIRYKYWNPLRNALGLFDYSYPERMSRNLEHVINALIKDPFTRRAYLPIISQADLADDFSKRFPCTIGYHFLYRQDKLHITYHLRSSDYFEHLPNDMWLANRLQNYVAEKAGLKPGFFCHQIGSLHCFSRDVKEVF